jgi:hypothetical protein
VPLSTPKIDVIDSCVEALSCLLRDSIQGLTVLQEWPDANQQLTYPSLTITKTKPVRTPSMPLDVFVTAPDQSNQVIANTYIADWDDTFQLDLWCRSKAERRFLTSQIVDVFNSQELDATSNNNANGLSILIPEQFNEYARFDMDQVQTVDDEAGSQRQERRTKITVLVNCREIRQRSYYAIKQIQSYTDLSNANSALTDDSIGTEPDNI